ncbi:MAG: hypothetical protein H7Y43_00265 [Akkermansiaceae bacterium]|nr:hypothetical protein [Verrucomicrobiales bacterium]
MKLQIRFSLSLLLALSPPIVGAQTAEDFFHTGAQSYLSNNVPVALQRVEEGRKRYPTDARLKKLEELLKRQQQSQSQQDQQDQSKDQEKKDQQQKQESKPDEKKDQQQSKSNQEKKDQPKPDQQKKPGEQKKDQEPDPSQDQAQATPGQMTPQQAKQLLDAQKGDEMMIPIRPEQKQTPKSGSLKDW